MSWWDAILDFGSSAADFAVKNPTLTGAVVGGLAGGTKGALKGAALGYGLSNLASGTFGGGAYEPPTVSNLFSSVPSAGGFSPTAGYGGTPSTPALPTSSSANMSTAPWAGAGATNFGGALTGSGAGNVTYTPGSSGVTGAFGGVTAPVSQGETMLGRVSEFGTKNPYLTSALIQGAGMLYGMSQQDKARQLAEQELGLRREALASQQQALAKNTAVADYWNKQAQQSADEARSLYNPQEMGLRSMAQQQAATGRRIQELGDLSSKGWSPADIEAEKRRAKVAGSEAATTGYLAGLDTGRKAQAAELSGAKGLAASYGGLEVTPDYSGAKYFADQGQADADTLRKMLEIYTGQPTKVIGEQQRKKDQQESLP